MEKEPCEFCNKGYVPLTGIPILRCDNCGIRFRIKPTESKISEFLCNICDRRVDIKEISYCGGAWCNDCS